MESEKKLFNEFDLIKTIYPILLPRKGDLLSERKNKEE